MKKERLLVVNEAIRDGIPKVSEKHQLWEGTIRAWAQRLGREIPEPTEQFSPQEKRAIVQEGIQNGMSLTCRAYRIDLATLRLWRRKFRL